MGRMRENKLRALWLGVLLLMWMVLEPSLVQARIAFVFKVEDGGTIAITNWPNSAQADTRVRLYGVRTPLWKEPYGKEAREFLENYLPKGAKIEISSVTNSVEDGMEEVLLQVNGHSLNYALVDEGLAWVDRRSCKSSYCRRWYLVEHNAVEARKGVWGLDLETPPWQWSN
ncbi:MAG: thermonuclease family protein [Desulfovibrionaceae bacterium]|nr:thermonuclease family protein [Desulfovibrionaceae bacterium]